MCAQEKRYDVAFSFAGEDRPYVEKVVEILHAVGLEVFYDRYETAQLWGKDLYTHLRAVYQDLAQYTVIFISRHYAEKLWTNHERESAQARAFQENREYILPARFDDTAIPGLTATTGFVDLRVTEPPVLASLILEKLGITDAGESPIHQISEVEKTDRLLAQRVRAWTDSFENFVNATTQLYWENDVAEWIRRKQMGPLWKIILPFRDATKRHLIIELKMELTDLKGKIVLQQLENRYNAKLLLAQRRELTAPPGVRVGDKGNSRVSRGCRDSREYEMLGWAVASDLFV
jgi:hypothetical protein